MRNGVLLHTILDNSHVIQASHHTVRVRNDGELDVAARHLGDVLDPGGMAVGRVGRQADQLGATLSELWFELGKGAELSGAHGREVLRMREQDGPAALDVLVEFDLANVAVSGEVGGLGAETERAGHFGCCDVCLRLAFCHGLTSMM